MRTAYTIIIIGLSTQMFAQVDSCRITEASTVLFNVDNLLVNTVTGHFKNIEGVALIHSAQPESSSIDVRLDAATIDTGNKKRDAHLLESDFFDVVKHPYITVKSQNISHAAAEGKYVFEGELSIKGITKTIRTSFSTAQDERGLWLTGNFALMRKDYDLGADYSKLTIGEEVEVQVKLRCEPMRR